MLINQGIYAFSMVLLRRKQAFLIRLSETLTDNTELQSDGVIDDKQTSLTHQDPLLQDARDAEQA
jgi:hypothetical protein